MSNTTKNNPTEVTLLEIIAQTLSIPVKSLSIDSSSDNTAKWDSLAHMNLIFAIEDSFGIQISDDDLPNSMSVRKLIEIIQKG